MRILLAMLLLGLPLFAATDERTRALAEHIEGLEHNQVLTDAARVQQMYDALIAIADFTPDPLVAPLLERHAAAGYRLPGFRTDEGHRTAIMTHDTAAAAKFALQQWERQRGRVHAVHALADQSGTIDYTVSEGMLAGYAQGFAAASDADLAVARNGLGDALKAGRPVESLALILVERLADRGLATLLLEQGRPGIVVHMLPRIAKAFPADDAVPILVAGTTRGELASALVAQIGKLSGKSHAAHTWLLDQFGDDRLGTSAAAALALTENPIAIAAMVDKLHGPGTPLARSRAALGLKLSGTRAARDALQKFADDPNAPPALRAQVTDWLR
ncbi:MAG: hypothetical protein WD081_06310 [Gammaproteobacteria bacterium]